MPSFDVYNTLGYGFLEFVYSIAMERELLKVVVEMPGHIRSDDPLRNLVRQAQ